VRLDRYVLSAITCGVLFQNAYLPTMPEDEKEMVREALLATRGGENPVMYSKILIIIYCLNLCIIVSRS